jgi:hypothetical protein
VNQVAIIPNLKTVLLLCILEGAKKESFKRVSKQLCLFHRALEIYEQINFYIRILRLGAQSFTMLNTLRDPTKLRRRQWATRKQHLFFGCPLLSSLEQLISAPNHE